MSIKESYYYIFYIFYKLFDRFKTTRWLMETKAAIVIAILEVWILFSIINYYDFINGKRVDLAFSSPIILIPFIAIVALKCYLFIFNDTWKVYVKEFDEWPKTKNRRGGWIVVFIVILVISNFIFSFYLNPPPGGLRW